MTPNPSVAPMTIDNATPNPARPKTPADFATVADTFNTAMDAAIRAKADAETKLEALMQRREEIVAGASDYGVTGKYGRAVLRKS